MPLSSPFVSGTMDIEKNWIDYNGHLNMAYYNVLFDRGAEEVLDLLGIGSAYAAERRHTIYTSEIHVCYVRELHLGSQVKVSFQLLDSDEKRLHAYQEIRHVDGWLAATSESMSLHVNMEGPRVAPFPEDVAAKVAAFQDAHRHLPRPGRAGRTIGILRRGSADINLKK